MVSNEERKIDKKLIKLIEKNKTKFKNLLKIKKSSKKSIEKEPLKNKNTCPICRTINPIGARFCKSCGKNFDEAKDEFEQHKEFIEYNYANYLFYAQQKEGEANIEKNMDLLVKSNNYTYIKDFVNRFGNSYTEADFKKLQETLNRKGFKINKRSDLKSLIIHIRELERYKNFKSLLNHGNPVYVTEYVKRLINLYGDDYPKQLHKLRKLLIEEKGFSQRRVDLVIAKITEEQKEENKLSNDLFKNQAYLSINKIDSLSGFEFENFLHHLFQKMGFKVNSTKLSGDQGADLIIVNHNDKIVVQAKRYSNNVGNKAVQEVVASIAHYGANKGMVVTNSQFTKSAIELAKSNEIQLIDRNKLKVLIEKYPIGNNEI